MGERVSGTNVKDRPDLQAMAERAGAGYPSLPSGHRSGSPGDPQGLPLSLGGAPPFVSPFNRPPLPADFVNGRFMASPEGSGLNTGLDIAKYSDERYKRGHLIDAAYRGQLDTVYDNVRQGHASLPMMPGYPNSRPEGVYFGWPGEDVVGSSSYGRIENSRLNRSLESQDLVRKHLAHTPDQYSMERSLAFSSRYGSLSSVPSSLPVNTAMENFPDSSSAPVARHGSEAAEERTQTPVSRAVPPSYSPIVTTSNFVYTAPSSMHSFGCFSPSSFPPGMYGSYSSSMPPLPNYNLPNAPPPAHASAGRRSANNTESRQSPNEFGDKPLDASLPHDHMGMAPQWNYSNPPASREEPYAPPFKEQAQEEHRSEQDRRGGAFDRQTSSSLSARGAANSHLGKQSASTKGEQSRGSSQAQCSRQSESGQQYAQAGACLMSTEGNQMSSSVVSSKSSPMSVPCHSQANMESFVNALQQQQPAQFASQKDKGSTVSTYTPANLATQKNTPQRGTRKEKSQTAQINQKSPVVQTDQRSQTAQTNQKSQIAQTNQKSPVVQTDQRSQIAQTNQKSPVVQTDQRSQTAQTNQKSQIAQTNQKSQTAQTYQKIQTAQTNQSFPVKATNKTNTSSDEKKFKNCGQQTELIAKPSKYQRRVDYKNDAPKSESVDSKDGKRQQPEKGIVGVDHKLPKAEISIDSSPVQLFKDELDLYDSSTSEYEPPSPYHGRLKKGERLPKKKMPVRRKSTAASSVKNTVLPSKEVNIQMTEPVLKANKSATVTKARRPKGKRARSRTTKRPHAQKPKKSPVKKNKVCPICQKTFSRADSLTCHMRVHTGERPYHCDQCGATYKVSSHLRDHIRSKHSNTRMFGCEMCGKTFTYSTARHRHEKICGKALSERVEYQCPNCKKGFVTEKGYSKHQQKCGVTLPPDGSGRPLRCISCKKSFASFAALTRHQRLICSSHLHVARYICRDCGKVFQKRNLYLAHTRRHTGEKPFSCNKCDARFYERSTLRRHIDRHDGRRRFQCCQCEAAFCLKRYLSIHVMRAHSGMKPFKCHECYLDFASESNYSKHVRHIHKQERRFKCMLCTKYFFDSRSWFMHARRHAQQSSRLIGKETTKKHICRLCNGVFFMRDLHAHIASEHPGVALDGAVAKQMPTCNFCLKTFSCPESLRMHSLRHTGEKPFQCDQCGMKFLLKCVLVLHQRKHSEYLPYSCFKCAKKFRWRASLSQHMMTHHSSKRKNSNDSGKKFTCGECGKDFKRQSCLNVHAKRHRQVLPCVCSQCGKGFVDTCRLKIHMSVHDGPKPFMCETCGAGFFYQYLLDDHVKRRHRQQPKGGWLCNQCGKALSRRDSYQKHMALHAKYPDGKIPKAGRSKGCKGTSHSGSLSPQRADYVPSAAPGGPVARDSGNQQAWMNMPVFPGLQEMPVANPLPVGDQAKSAAFCSGSGMQEAPGVAVPLSGSAAAQSKTFESSPAMTANTRKDEQVELTNMNLAGSGDLQPNSGSMLFPGHDQNYLYHPDAYNNYMHQQRMPWYNGHQH